MKYVALIVYVVVLAACGGSSKSPTTPTSVTPAPSVVAMPPVAPPTAPTDRPSTPTIPTYAGVWSGQYIIDSCSGQGSLEDLFCSRPSGSRPGGVYPPGTRLPITFDLSQNGTSVSGLVSWGQVRGTLIGTVRANDLLTMNGTATGGPYTMNVTYWDTQAIGNELVGFISFDTRFTGINGFASVATRLTGVRR